MSARGEKAFINIDLDNSAAWHVEYLRKVNEVPGIKKYKNKVLKLLDPQPEDLILDVGCGLGLDLQRVYNRIPTAGKLVGVDFSRTMVKQASKSLSEDQRASIDYLQNDAYTLSFRDELFHGVYADRIFQHLGNPEIAFREMQRVTKAGGRIIVADTDWSTFQISGTSSETAEKIKNVYLNIVANPHMGGELQRLFKEFGLKDIEPFEQAVHLSGLQAIKDVLGLEKSLDLVRMNGKISESDAHQCLDEVNNSQEPLRASLAIHIVKGIKTW